MNIIAFDIILKLIETIRTKTSHHNYHIYLYTTYADNTCFLNDENSVRELIKLFIYSQSFMLLILTFQDVKFKVQVICTGLQWRSAVKLIDLSNGNIKTLGIIFFLQPKLASGKNILQNVLKSWRMRINWRNQKSERIHLEQLNSHTKNIELYATVLKTMVPKSVDINITVVNF